MSKREPTLTCLETCWRLKGPSGRVFECGIYRTDAPGLEVRCGFGADDLLRSQRSAGVFSARAIADDWKAAVIAKGGFECML